MPSADRTSAELERNSFLHGEMAERFGEGNTLSVPTVMRRGGSENCLDLDTTDLAGRDVSRSRPALDSLQQKILKIKEQLRIEQNLQDENVAEYLKLIGSADKQQSSRIKQVFEKKNQKTAHNIVQLQKKLEQYQRKMKECDVLNGTKHTLPPVKDLHEFPKDNFKETLVTGSGRHPHLDKVKTIGPGVSLSPPFFFSKSREIANLIRNKFGSADNIAHLKSSMETGGGLQTEGGGRVLSGSATLTSKHKYPSDDECSTETSLSVESNGHVSGLGLMGQNSGFGKEGGQEDNSRLVEAWEEIRELREAQNLLAEDLESLKTQFKCDFESITQTVQEERYRCEQLEDQLNDLTELHQNETANLKQELASIEEKMTYQVYDRARDIQEALEACQTRMGKLELQQQQQQALQLEGADAKVLLGKCINIMLAIVTVILVCVSTAAKFSAPLMRSRLHVFGTFLCVCLLAFGWSNWEHLTRAVERMLVPR